jgi:hypothetical protein
MKADEKYAHVFGGIQSLAEHVSWSTGLSNMLEWLVWNTKDVLGVTKSEYRQRIVEWTHDERVRDASLEAKQAFADQRFKTEIERTEQTERYASTGSGLASPRELLRRAKYFSEDYLNKEFDVFWSLVSDRYLDAFYDQFTQVQGGNIWYRHGNSGLFASSTAIRAMQMDNLTYNPAEALLVANELKLGGKKNKDQILKYALMYRQLRDRGFIAPHTRFLLLFIGDTKVNGAWETLITEEIRYCRGSTKSTARDALHPEGIEVALGAQYATMTWHELMAFNASHFAGLDVVTQQVEQKLLAGFNESLGTKKFMQESKQK